MAATVSAGRTACRLGLYLTLAAAPLSGCRSSVTVKDTDVREGAKDFVTSPRFNQHILEYYWEPSSATAGKLPPDTISVDSDGPDLGDPASVVEFILQAAPKRAIVYPTEQYYYFEFYAGARLISGNLRFTDSDKGILNTGYFDRFDRSFLQSASLGPDDGIDLHRDPEARTARVRFRGISRTFTFPKPKSAEVRTHPSEEHIAAVLDESGHLFHLLFHHPTSQFYFILAPDGVRPEPLVRIADNPSIDIGIRSRFVFLNEPTLHRTVLVGVHASAVRANSIYDGPFDQVPPDLSIRRQLESAYPYVKMRGGIDEHGNFIELTDQRVAISPYTDYQSISSFIANIQNRFDPNLESPKSFAALVYESKRDAHIRLQTNQHDPAPQADQPIVIRSTHNTATSKAWPYDHAQRSSADWPQDHDQPQSLSAPPNKPLNDR